MIIICYEDSSKLSELSFEDKVNMLIDVCNKQDQLIRNLQFKLNDYENN